MVKTTLPIQSETRERLKNYGKKGATWDKLLNDLMDEVDTLNAATTDLSYQVMNGQ